jgi:hypothetical protein
MKMELNEKACYHANMSELEKEILNIINEVTESNYVGGLKVTYENGIYILFLYLDVEYAPIQLGFEGSENDFKNYIRNELKSRRLECVPRGRLVQQVIINHEERRDCKN